jgi:hypothetical protein
MAQSDAGRAIFLPTGRAARRGQKSLPALQKKLIFDKYLRIKIKVF